MRPASPRSSGGKKNLNCCCGAGRGRRPAKARWSPLRRGRYRQVTAYSCAAGTLAGEPHTRLRYFCSPQHTDSAFYPIISQMERAAGFVYDDIAASEARQTGRDVGADLDLKAGRGAVRRDAVAAE